ncbi:hypothetical protein SESBI_00207 [Sesbania bispinosa]|nr:hypothetical protein SESBI_00207 [Sesbania bispinosa]
MVGAPQLEYVDVQTMKASQAGSVVSSRPSHRHDQVTKRLDVVLDDVARDAVLVEGVDPDNFSSGENAQVRDASFENHASLGVGGSEGVHEDSKALCLSLMVSDSNMGLCSRLDKESHDVAYSIWKIGLDLGVSGFDDESVMIDKLVEMEKRDQLAIGRSFR